MNFAYILYDVFSVADDTEKALMVQFKMKMQSIRRQFVSMCSVLALTLFSSNASAITITVSPGTGLCTAISPQCLVTTGTDNSNLDADGIEGKLSGVSYGNTLELTEDYKANVDSPVVEEKAFASMYATTFSNEPTDPSEATIVHESGATITGDEIYLFIKGGHGEPSWYLFDISNWNGTDGINMTAFWPNKNAISHVSIFSGEGDGGGADPACIDCPVPEPAPIALFGFGLSLLGLVKLMRRS